MDTDEENSNTPFADMMVVIIAWLIASALVYIVLLKLKLINQ